MYPFSIGGAVVGVLIGFILALNAVKAQKALPAQAQVIRERQLEAKRAKALASRKEEFRERFRQQDKGISARLAGSRQIENPSDVRDGLLQGLENYCDGASGPAASKRLIEIWDDAQSNTRRLSTAEAEEGFRVHREEANKLYADGKLGEAIKRIRKAEAQFQSTHGEEIDRFIERVSQELDDRWAADLARATELSRGGDSDSAVELMRKAMDYGDHQIRSEADRKIQEFQAAALVASRTGDAASEQDDDKPTKDDDSELEDDLEAEFEEFEGE